MILRLYRYLGRHTALMFTSLGVITLLLVCLVLRLHYKEDISDFLPLGTKDRDALTVYQNISGANRLYIVFRNNQNPDSTIEAIDCFTSLVRENDSLEWCKDLTAQIDAEKISKVTDFVYDNIPYFLTNEDCNRIDTLLSNPNYIEQKLQEDRQTLMQPGGNMMASKIQHDPLDLFSPVLARLHSSISTNNFEMYGGYIFTPDMSRAIVMLSSPFGNSETEMNGKLCAMLGKCIQQTQQQHTKVEATIVGGPEIAVGNANRIRTDSIIAIALTSVLMLALLLYSLRSLRNILLIVVSVGWGWLFALGALAVFHDTASIIVIGISSVILGIAVNYPLHLIVHSGHASSIKSTLKEIMVPLVVGNITTVGAFLALVPLKSTALRDLGLFASFLLIGTILFTLVYLPHLVRTNTTESREVKTPMLNKIASFCPENYKWIVATVAVLTVFFGYYSLRASFDSNMANINYMTDEQRSEMEYFQNIASGDSTKSCLATIYAAFSDTTLDGALQKYKNELGAIEQMQYDRKIIKQHSNISQFLCTKDEQKERIGHWQQTAEKHYNELNNDVEYYGRKCGFSPDAFSSFTNLVKNSGKYKPQNANYFEPLASQVYSSNICYDKQSRKYSVVDVLRVNDKDVEEVERNVSGAFDVVSMNSAIADNLSDNFNYIGWACSLIVFFFLWFSFGKLELALISFIPMAVSWLWILGIMAIAGIKFNIVNVILATFIFGQGDDYTIFMTEGCQYEYAYHKPMLASYKNSIIQSALIMFIGIGTLIVSKHPAMFSLAQVTIIGMFCVVLMAYMLPPLLFKFITTKNGRTRRQPLTIASVLGIRKNSPEALVKSRYMYKGRVITSTVNRNLANSSKYMQLIDSKLCGNSVIINNTGYGEIPLLYALKHPDVDVRVIEPAADKRLIARYSAEGIAKNICFMKKEKCRQRKVIRENVDSADTIEKIEKFIQALQGQQNK